MTEASTRLDTIQRGNERAIARIGGTISAGFLITNSLIKILNPDGKTVADHDGKLEISPSLAANIKARNWG